MANYVRYAAAIVIIIGVVGEQAFADSVLEDADRNVLGLNVPYGRGLVSVRPREVRMEIKNNAPFVIF